MIHPLFKLSNNRLLNQSATLVLTRRALVATVALLSAIQVQAATFDWGGVQVNLDSSLSYGVSMRTGSPDCNLIGQDNGGCATTEQTEVAKSNSEAFYQTYDGKRINQDDGNLNYKKNAITASTIKGTHDLFMGFGSGWSSLVRGVWSADSAFKNADGRPEIAKDAKDEAKFNAQLLDAYVNYRFNFGQRPGKVRVGNQVVSWGEDLFTPGGINSINALDLRRAHTPGVQIKEVLLPAPIALFSVPVGRSGSIEAYYQLGWNKTVLDPAGSFYSTADSLGKGGRRGYANTAGLKSLASKLPDAQGGLTAPGGQLVSGAPLGETDYVAIGGPKVENGVAPTWAADAAQAGVDAGVKEATRGAVANLPVSSALPTGTLGDNSALGESASIANLGDTKAKDGGQYGLSYRFTLASDDTLGVYYLRYHEKTPHPIYTTAPGTTTGLGGVGFAYAEDRDLFGFSYNTKLGDWTIGTELSYRPKDSVIIDPTIVKDLTLIGGTNTNAYYCDTKTLQNCVGKVDVAKTQWHLTALHNLSPSSSMGWLLRGLGAAEGSVATELVMASYGGLDLSGAVPYDVTNDGRMPTKNSSGAVLNVGVNYPNFWGTSLAFAPDLTYSRGLSGISATGMPGFIEGASSLGLGFTLNFNARYATALRADVVSYAGASNPLLDRNMASLSLSTSF